KETWVRVWECRSGLQRRVTPRRRVRFAVRFRPLETGSHSHASDEGSEWQHGWCLDIGGGGMRLRAPKQTMLPEHLLLEFCLPSRENDDSVSPSRAFCLAGRVVRMEKYGRFRDGLDMAIRFERLSAEDGLAIASFLN